MRHARQHGTCTGHSASAATTSPSTSRLSPSPSMRPCANLSGPCHSSGARMATHPALPDIVALRHGRHTARRLGGALPRPCLVHAVDSLHLDGRGRDAPVGTRVAPLSSATVRWGRRPWRRRLVVGGLRRRHAVHRIDGRGVVGPKHPLHESRLLRTGIRTRIAAAAPPMSRHRGRPIQRVRGLGGGGAQRLPSGGGAAVVAGASTAPPTACHVHLRLRLRLTQPCRGARIVGDPLPLLCRVRARAAEATLTARRAPQPVVCAGARPSLLRLRARAAVAARRGGLWRRRRSRRPAARLRARRSGRRRGGTAQPRGCRRRPVGAVRHAECPRSDVGETVQRLRCTLGAAATRPPPPSSVGGLLP